MHILESCGFEKETEKRFKMIRPRFAIHVYIKQDGWGAGVARESQDFELTDTYYQVDKASPDVVWGQKTYSNPVAAALAAVQFILHFSFVENCDEDLESLAELIKSQIDDYVGEDITDDDKRKQRIQESMEKGIDNWKE